MPLETLQPSKAGETVPETTQLREQFNKLVRAETWNDSVEIYEKMAKPIFKEVAALDEFADLEVGSDELKQHEIDPLFEEAHEQKVEQLKQQIETMTEVFMEKPYEAFVAEALQLFELSVDRSVSEIDPVTGATKTEFVTRDASRTKADMHFEQVRRTDGSWQIRVEMPLRGHDSGLPVVMTADSVGNLKVEQKTYHHYRYDMIDLPTDDEADPRASDRLQQYFKDTLVATGLVYDRPAEHREAADKQAKHFLYQRKKALVAV